MTKISAEQQPRKERGIFERPKDSGVWWVRYADDNGRIHREKVGSKSRAKTLYEKRKTQVREHRLFPEQFRRHEVQIGEAVRSYVAARKDRRSHKALGRKHWPVVAFALHTGLRQGEQLGLRWEDVDFRYPVRGKMERARRESNPRPTA